MRGVLLALALAACTGPVILGERGANDLSPAPFDMTQIPTDLTQGPTDLTQPPDLSGDLLPHDVIDLAHPDQDAAVRDL